MTDNKTTIDPCFHCGESTAFGSGNFVNRIPVDDGWGCGKCSGFICTGCGELIYIDCEIVDKDDTGDFHAKCLPLDRHQDDCDCELHDQK